jgi:ring-1,2-phenylacetyl-CoA epoxidase subunit PaaE
MSTPQFHTLPITRVSPEAAGAVSLTFSVPPALREQFQFEPGQFLTLRSTVNGRDIRRSYSISSPRQRFAECGELEVGIRPVEGGVFSNWAAQALKSGDTLAVMPPDGRFVSQRPRAIHRVGFAAGSGITPILSIMATTLAEQPHSKFTLVFGNRRMNSVMFNEALQDLKDRYPDRLTLIHVLSRQAQEVPLLEGRIDEAKVNELIATLLPVGSMDEVFVCGPDAMITSTENALLAAGVKPERIRTERFFSPDAPQGWREASELSAAEKAKGAQKVKLTLELDGKTHEIDMRRDEAILDAALNAGLDLPYSCKAGVCCTCRAKVLDGQVEMLRNFTLEAGEMAQGFVLTCQAQPRCDSLRVSFDDR